MITDVSSPYNPVGLLWFRLLLPYCSVVGGYKTEWVQNINTSVIWETKPVQNISGSIPGCFERSKYFAQFHSRERIQTGDALNAPVSVWSHVQCLKHKPIFASTRTWQITKPVSYGSCPHTRSCKSEQCVNGLFTSVQILPSNFFSLLKTSLTQQFHPQNLLRTSEPFRRN